MLFQTDGRLAAVCLSVRAWRAILEFLVEPCNHECYDGGKTLAMLQDSVNVVLTENPVRTAISRASVSRAFRLRGSSAMGRRPP